MTELPMTLPPRVRKVAHEYAQRAHAHKRRRRLDDVAVSVWAALALDDDGQETVVFDPAGHPMMDLDEELVKLSKPLLTELAKLLRRDIRIVRFDRAVTVDVIEAEER